MLGHICKKEKLSQCTGTVVVVVVYFKYLKQIKTFVMIFLLNVRFYGNLKQDPYGTSKYQTP